MSAITVDGEEAWRRVRLLRSDPPGRAAREGQRRRTFGAALDQAEELWRAGERVSSNASPIVLYYSLTQGARALCAARIDGGEWDGAPSHGLTLLRPDAQQDAAPSLSSITVRTHGRGFVQQVADLLESPTLNDSADLAALLHSLPEHAEFMLIDNATAARPLEVHDSTFFERSTISHPPHDVSAFVGPLPTHLEHRAEPNTASHWPDSPTVDEVVAWFSKYPSLSAAGRPFSIGYRNPLALSRPIQSGVHVHWNLEKEVPWGQSATWFKTIIDVITADPVGAGMSGLALPAVAGNTAALHPLVAWWIVLYTCSMLARYHPRSWVALLDVDTCVSAVPLGLVLEVAHRTMPALLLR